MQEVRRTEGVADSPALHRGTGAACGYRRNVPVTRPRHRGSAFNLTDAARWSQPPTPSLLQGSTGVPDAPPAPAATHAVAAHDSVACGSAPPRSRRAVRSAGGEPNFTTVNGCDRCSVTLVGPCRSLAGRGHYPCPVRTYIPVRSASSRCHPESPCRAAEEGCGDVWSAVRSRRGACAAEFLTPSAPSRGAV